MAKEPKVKSGGRLHKATFATDKKNPGKYLIRVIGPNAGAFAGRAVPVIKKDDTETVETLTKCIWLGVDDGTAERPGSGEPAALYKFEEKPKEELDADEIPF